MSRPLARRCLAPGTTVAPGEVMVATEIGDPARGLLPCPAAPLVGGVLERRGIPIRYGPVPYKLYQHRLITGGDASSVTLFCLNHEPPYTFAIDALNSSGRTKGDARATAP